MSVSLIGQWVTLVVRGCGEVVSYKFTGHSGSGEWGWGGRGVYKKKGGVIDRKKSCVWTPERSWGGGEGERRELRYAGSLEDVCWKKEDIMRVWESVSAEKNGVPKIRLQSKHKHSWTVGGEDRNLKACAVGKINTWDSLCRGR